MKFFIVMFLIFKNSLSFSAIDCDFQVNLSNAVVNISESAQVVQQPFTIKRQGPNEAFCDSYRAYFSKGSANSYQRKAFNSNGDSLDYNLHQNISMIGSLKQYGDAFFLVEYLSGSTSTRNQTYNGRFFISVPGTSSQNSSVGGIFTDNVQVTFYGQHFISGQVLDGVQTFTVSIIVPTKISVSVVDEGAAHDASSTTKVINFGYLSINQEKAADIRVVSNTPYRIQMSSLNNGNLKHSASSNQIGYEMKINNNVVPLGSSMGAPVTVASGNKTNSAGDKFSARMKIKTDVANKAAGTYEDVITITAIAN